jgi:hypothetical protein
MFRAKARSLIREGAKSFPPLREIPFDYIQPSA